LSHDFVQVSKVVAATGRVSDQPLTVNNHIKRNRKSDMPNIFHKKSFSPTMPVRKQPMNSARLSRFTRQVCGTCARPDRRVRPQELRIVSTAPISAGTVMKRAASDCRILIRG